MARLGDICVQITDGSHNPPAAIEESKYLMISSKNIDDDCITLTNPRYLSKKDFETENKRTNISVNDLLVTIVGTIGRVAIVPDNLRNICAQRSVAVLKPKSDIVNSRFLMYYLQHMRPQLEREARGVAQKGIYLKQLSNLMVVLPPLDKQKKIVSVMDKVSDLIAKRRAQLDKLDLLVKARFVEMFGDSYVNPYKLPMARWNDVFYTTTGKLDSNAAVDNGEYPFFTCSKETLRIDKYAFDQEALLLAGNNAAGKYDVKHYKGKFNAYQRTYVLSLKHDWSYALFQFQLEDKLGYLEQQSLGGLTKYLTLKILNELEFIIPEKSEQDKFAVFVEQIEKLKLTILHSFEKLETLKKALMQKYFE